METLTIDLSTILFHLFVYYICFNFITILINWGDYFTNQTKTIKKILNPFRDFEMEYSGALKFYYLTFYMALMLVSAIPYLLIIWIESEISKYTINIIW